MRGPESAAPHPTGIAGTDKVITLHINGQQQTFPASLTLAELLDQLAMTGKRLAVDRNGEIVPKSQHATTRLVDGDTLEIVVAVGGG